MSNAWHIIIMFQELVNHVTYTPNIMSLYYIVTDLGCPIKLYGMILLLMTAHYWIIRNGKIKLVPTWKFQPYAPSSKLHGILSREYTNWPSYIVVNPVSYHKIWYKKITNWYMSIINIKGVSKFFLIWFKTCSLR